MATAVHADHGLHISSVKFNVSILGALLFLTLLTYLTALMDLGWVDTPLALVIAFGKTSLVILYFMHVRWSSGYVKVLSATGFGFLMLLFGFTLADISTRTQEHPWGEYTWPGAAHRTGMVGDVPAPPPSVEGILPELGDEAGDGHHAPAADHGHGKPEAVEHGHAPEHGPASEHGH